MIFLDVLEGRGVFLICLKLNMIDRREIMAIYGVQIINKASDTVAPQGCRREAGTHDRKSLEQIFKDAGIPVDNRLRTMLRNGDVADSEVCVELTTTQADHLRKNKEPEMLVRVCI